MAVKYVVFKVEEWSTFMGTEGKPSDLLTLLKGQVRDAEVIRHQDLAAAPIYSAYAHMIISFRDLLKSQGTIGYGGLTEIADHFHEAAVEAEQLPHRRLPD